MFMWQQAYKGAWIDFGPGLVHVWREYRWGGGGVSTLKLSPETAAKQHLCANLQMAMTENETLDTRGLILE